MSLHLRSKKMALLTAPGQGVTARTDITKMVRTGPMASPKFPLDRRELMAGLGAAALTSMWPVAGRAQGSLQGSLQGRTSLALQATAGSLALRPGSAATPVWSLQGPELAFKRGETV